MSQRRFGSLIVLALGSLALWWQLAHKASDTSSSNPAPTGAKAGHSPALVSASAPPAASNATPKGSPPTPQAGTSTAATGQTPSATTRTPPQPPPPKPISDTRRYANEMQGITLMLRDYRTLFQGNPVGSNAEIMQRIMGGNPKHARLGPPEGEHLNEQGELVDRWNTPYFFHQQSATQMEIHSAGPDKRMGTADDIVVR